MLSFITFKDAPEQLEIIGDNQGIDQLIAYLEEIKKGKDHIHLIIDTEIDPFPIQGSREGKTLYAKQVRLEYADKQQWSVAPAEKKDN